MSQYKCIERCIYQGVIFEVDDTVTYVDEEPAVAPPARFFEPVTEPPKASRKRGSSVE